MYAEFTDDLVTGNEMIDGQHRELIGKINDPLVSCEDRSNQSGAARLLNYLADLRNFILMRKKHSRKRLDIPALRSTRKSTENCAIQYRSFMICLPRKKALLMPSLPRFLKM